MKATSTLLTLLAVFSAAASAGPIYARAGAKSGADIQKTVIETGSKRGAPVSKVSFWKTLPISVWNQLYDLEARAGGKDGRPLDATVVPALEKAYNQIFAGQIPTFPAKPPGKIQGGAVIPPPVAPKPDLKNVSPNTTVKTVATTTHAPVASLPPSASNIAPAVAAPSAKAAPAPVHKIAQRSAKLTGDRLRSTFMNGIDRKGYAASQVAFYKSIPQTTWNRLADLSCNQVTPTGKVDYAVKAKLNRAWGDIFSNRLPTFN
ncbi:hypothetical protein TWF694_001375 [Orbilia ellipsospora]|uniref:Uncharacterized protein n=1 Tax=Orbilia ellipsospora TaxID=2528407 RepID=A0AAV9XRH8_9PEZI